MVSDLIQKLAIVIFLSKLILSVENSKLGQYYCMDAPPRH